MPNVCPENIDFKFVFEGQCPIETCQHCNKVTKTGCLFIDRKESSDRPITNKEISHYKRSLFPEFADYDQKALDGLVRQTQVRTRAAICMQSYINWLAEHVEPVDVEYTPSYAIVHEVQSYLTQTFDAYEPWMIFMMDDEQRFSAAVGAVAKTDITLGQALGRMTQKKFETFCQTLAHLRTT